ncbi:hypothetical protein AB0F88_16625 [Streptosporangium sp. NPDC023963]|uniref:hypothetical protein n=1 Tax=Streptosporangium sp. NPDC023963 TaxID=3155608 RepID=UPI00344171AB
MSDNNERFSVALASKDPFGMIYFEVLDDDRLDRNAKDAYVCLVRCADYYDRTLEELTRADIAAVMGMSVDSFDRGLKKLVACGYVEVLVRFQSGTKSRAPSGYVLYDSKLARLERDIREKSDATAKSAPVDNLPQVSRAKLQDEVKTAGQGGRTERPPQNGHSGALAAGSGNPCRSQRPPLPQGAVAIPYRGFKGRGETPLPSLPTPEDLAVDEEEGEEIMELVADLRRLRPDWSTRSIVRTLTDASVVERPWWIVRHAALALARDPVTQFPGRLLHDGPWWHAATQATDRPPVIPWCGTCSDPIRRRVEDAEARDLGPCPCCHFSIRKGA